MHEIIYIINIITNPKYSNFVNFSFIYFTPIISKIFGKKIIIPIQNAKKLIINTAPADTSLAFFENNLNISQTSKKTFMHRNTLVYRIEKIKTKGKCSTFI